MPGVRLLGAIGRFATPSTKRFWGGLVERRYESSLICCMLRARRSESVELEVVSPNSAPWEYVWQWLGKFIVACGPGTRGGDTMVVNPAKHGTKPPLMTRARQGLLSQTSQIDQMFVMRALGAYRGANQASACEQSLARKACCRDKRIGDAPVAATPKLEAWPDPQTRPARVGSRRYLGECCLARMAKVAHVVPFVRNAGALFMARRCIVRTATFSPDSGPFAVTACSTRCGWVNSAVLLEPSSPKTDERTPVRVKRQRLSRGRLFKLDEKLFAGRLCSPSGPSRPIIYR